MNFIRQLDFFGSPLQIQISSNQSVYKSCIGGLFSILVVAASIFYSIWMTYQWQTNQLNPKLTQTSYLSDFKRLDLSRQLIKISSWKYSDELLDPIKERILLPIVKYSDKKYHQYKSHVLEIANITSDYHASVVSPSMEINFQDQEGYQKSITEMEVILILCEDYLLQEGQQCASKEKRDMYFNQSNNYIAISFDLTVINSQTQQSETSVQSFYLSIETEFCQGLNVYLESHSFEIRNQIFFASSDLKEFLSVATGIHQTNTNNFCQKAYGYNSVLGRMYITWNNDQKYIILDYPKASDILANIGSIVSVLFLIKHLVFFLNHRFLNEAMVNEMISFYYPQFKKIKIEKNCFSRISRVSFNNEEINREDFNRFYSKVSQQIEFKLSFQNLWYEISRLYFLVRSIRSKDEIRKSHKLGIKLQLSDVLSRRSLGQEFETIGSRDIIYQHQRDQTLGIDDINLISLKERQRQLSEAPEEEMYAEDFFTTNICGWPNN